MLDKATLGNRFVCFECGCKFYDLNKPEPLCPDCNANQHDAPEEDIRSLLSGRGRPIPRPDEDEDEDLDLTGAEDNDDDDDLGHVDDDDDDDLGDEDEE